MTAPAVDIVDVHRPIAVMFAGEMVTLDGQVIALVPRSAPGIADRIRDLLNMHGLVEIPMVLPPDFGADL